MDKRQFRYIKRIADTLEEILEVCMSIEEALYEFEFDPDDEPKPMPIEEKEKKDEEKVDVKLVA